jgi:UDP:flavonoid glycosyltransferase YjiC (YdhE family)
VVLVDFRVTGSVSAALCEVPSAWLVNLNFFVHPFQDIWPDVRESLLSLGTPAAAVGRALGDAVLVPDLAMFEPISTLPASTLTGLAGLVREIRHVGPVLGTAVELVPDRVTARAQLASGDRPLVYVTMGGTAQGLPSLRTIVSRLGELDADAVVVSGPHIDEDELGPLPDNVMPLRFTSLAASYIRAADLVVCHGGHTTLMEAICLGTPALCVPQQPEQERNAQRLELLGVGQVVSPAALADDFVPTATKLLGCESTRARSAAAAMALSRHDGAAAAADHLELIAELRGVGEPGS